MVASHPEARSAREQIAAVAGNSGNRGNCAYGHCHCGDRSGASPGAITQQIHAKGEPRLVANANDKEKLKALAR